MSKNVQIPRELFIWLIRYFCIEDDDLLFEDIKNALESKLERLVAQETFTKYKRAPEGAEREQLRQKYLDLIGIHKDWRTDTEYHEPEPPECP